ncbi:MAG TPA: glycosyltransferase [Thermoanaerobaculia bacterium]
MTLISAIVSTYNSERFLRGCLEDLEAQTIAGRLEIIVIDSNSPQSEGEIVREFQQRHDNIRYVRTAERESLYAAWNRAIGLARGTYLTSANTDDRHRPDALERLTNALEANPGAALAYADAAVTLRENDTFHEDAAVFLRWPDFDRRRLFEVAFIGPQPVWRRDLHERHGLFDASFTAAADYEWWLRLAAAGETFVHVPEVLGLYLASPTSIEHRNPQLNWQESELARERYWRAEWGSRPRPHGFFLRFAWGRALRHLLRGDARPAREIATHLRMLMHGRKR